MVTKDCRDGVETELAEPIDPTAFKVGKDGGGDISCGKVGMKLAQPSDSSAEPRATETDATAEKRLGVWLPLGSESVESVSKPTRRVVVPSSMPSKTTLSVLLDLVERLAVATTPGTLALKVIVAATDDGGKVGGPVADIIAVGVEGEGALSALQRLDAKGAQGANEGFDGSAELIEAINARQQQADAPVLCPGLVAALCGKT